MLQRGCVLLCRGCAQAAERLDSAAQKGLQYAAQSGLRRTRRRALGVPPPCSEAAEGRRARAGGDVKLLKSAVNYRKNTGNYRNFM